MSQHENFRKIAQFMLARGCVKAEEFYVFLNSLRDEGASQMSESTAATGVANMNLKLKNFNMRIRESYDQNTHEKYYSIINTIDNAITKEASHHTAKEIEYFRLIWEIIRENPLDETQARRLASQIKLPSHEKLLQEWCDKLWLVRDDDEFRIGPRAIAELDVLM